MANSKKPYKGSCLCNSITFEVNAIEENMGRCHCTMCRKFHGAEFATYGEAKKGNFNWVTGEEFLSNYLAPNGTNRQFCKKCGSSLTFSPSANVDGLIEFSLGALDSEIEQHPDAHLFVESKPNWSTIQDDLPQYSASRSSEKIT